MKSPSLLTMFLEVEWEEMDYLVSSSRVFFVCVYVHVRFTYNTLL